LKRTPQVSLFHSREWLEALRQTYGYQPIVFTTSPPSADLANAIVFCQIESWLTGRRLVSLPFSDHCELLVDRPEDLSILMAAIDEELEKGKWRYVEARPLASIPGRANQRAAKIYYHHQMNLAPSIDELFRNLHKDSIQRKIRKAEREKLDYQEGTTDSLLDSFYELLVLTRRRHCVPPQPKRWFRTLRDCFGSALKIRIATKQGKPIAGMLTIRHKDCLIYKYGGSDPRFGTLGGMHLLYWKSIQEAKNDGLKSFDLGRSDAHQAGLITFKRRWGADESKLTYWRLGGSRESDTSHTFDLLRENWKSRLAKYVFANMPTSLLPAVGSLLYKHIG